MKGKYKFFVWLIILMLVPLGIYDFATKQRSVSTYKIMSEQTPEDFNFVLNYGVTGKNQIDTFSGTYTMDIFQEPLITAKIKFTKEEMDKIYKALRYIKIFDYPDYFYSGAGTVLRPHSSYILKVQANGIIKNIRWEDKGFSVSDRAAILRNLFQNIHFMIEQKDEYKKLPQLKEGYI